MFKLIAKNVVTLGALMVLASTAVPAVAADFSQIDALAERRRLLDIRQAEVDRLNRDSERLQRYVALLRDFTDHKLGGPEGILAAIKLWDSDFKAWLQRWDGVKQELAAVDRSNVLNTMDNINSTVNDLGLQLSKLLYRATTISSLSLQQKLGLDPVDDSLIVDQKSLVQSLNSNRAKMIEASDLVTAEFSTTKLAYLENSFFHTSSIIRQKMTAIALQFPELGDKVLEAKSMLEFLTSFSPTMSQVIQQSDEVMVAIGSSKFFAARRALEIMDVSLGKLITDISTANAPNTLKGDFLDKITAIKIATHRHFDDITQAASVPTLVSRYAHAQRLIISRDCSLPETVGLRNCELLRTLNSLDLSYVALKNWKEEDLAYLEGELDKVAKSPNWSKEKIK